MEAPSWLHWTHPSSYHRNLIPFSFPWSPDTCSGWLQRPAQISPRKHNFVINFSYPLGLGAWDIISITIQTSSDSNFVCGGWEGHWSHLCMLLITVELMGTTQACMLLLTWGVHKPSFQHQLKKGKQTASNTLLSGFTRYEIQTASKNTFLTLCAKCRYH